VTGRSLVDRITKSLLSKFVTDNALQSLPEDKAFEIFCGWLLTSAHHSDFFSTDDLVVGTGGGGDCGIDTISIVVNGCLVTDPDEVEDLEQTNGYIDATFIFVQAERSSSFDSAKIGQFGFGVRDFLSDSPSLVQNEDIALAAKTVAAVFERSLKFERGNPQCFMHYATTGHWADDSNLIARRDAAKRDVVELNLFRSVTFECLGAA
jgi:hypothetical protein